MAKRICLKDFIEVDGVAISSFCRSVEFNSEHETVDASGFNATGLDETLDGKTVQTVTLEVFDSYGTGEIFQTLYPLHRNKDIATFKWRADQTLAVSATNPQLTGNIKVSTWAQSSTRGEVGTWPVTLNTADATGLVFSNT